MRRDRGARRSSRAQSYCCPVIVTPALPPPAIEQPVAHQVTYGLVTGRAPRGTMRVVVTANGRRVASKPLQGRRFSLRVTFPVGDVTVRVTTIARRGRRSSAHVHDVFGLPAGCAATVRESAAGADSRAEDQEPRPRIRRHRGRLRPEPHRWCRCGVERTRTFPAASTLKLAIATTVLAQHEGIPARLEPRQPPHLDADALGQRVRQRPRGLARLARRAPASHRINELMRSIGLRETEMYGGYELRTLSSAGSRSASTAAGYGYGKYTTAWDLTSLLRAVWLASAGRGPLRSQQTGFTAADAPVPPVAPRARERRAENRPRTHG